MEAEEANRTRRATLSPGDVLIGDIVVDMDRDWDNVICDLTDAAKQLTFTGNMCIDGRPMTNMEMYAIRILHDEEDRIERWLFSFLEWIFDGEIPNDEYDEIYGADDEDGSRAN